MAAPSAFLMLIMISCFVPMTAANAKTRASYSAKSWHRLFGYSESGDKSSGQDHWLFFQQSAEFNSVFSFRGQVYAYAGNSKADLIQAQDKLDVRSQTSEVWPGDVYLQVASGPALFRIGYQQVSWQEGFAVSYTNFINARDTRASIFDDPDQIFRSAPVANLILSGEHLSFQALYIPFSQSDIRLPFSRWRSRRGVTPLAGQTVEIEKSPNFARGQEYGTRLTWAGQGFDASIFASRLRDRQAYYLASADSSPTNLKLTPQQEYISPVGVTSSVSLQDFTLRIEYLMMAQRRFNRVEGLNLTTADVGESAATLGLDSPNWEHVSFSIQHSISRLDREVSGLSRKQTEGISFGSFNYAFTQDQVLRLAMVYLEADQSLSGRLSFKWPISRRAELEAAYEGTAGPAGSQGSDSKDLNRFFIQLSHAL